jgi:hypothetical protein
MYFAEIFIAIHINTLIKLVNITYLVFVKKVLCGLIKMLTKADRL